MVSDSFQISQQKHFGTLQGTNVNTQTRHKVTGLTNKQGQDLNNKQLLARKEPLSFFIMKKLFAKMSLYLIIISKAAYLLRLGHLPILSLPRPTPTHLTNLSVHCNNGGL